MTLSVEFHLKSLISNIFNFINCQLKIIQQNMYSIFLQTLWARKIKLEAIKFGLVHDSLFLLLTLWCMQVPILTCSNHVKLFQTFWFES